LIAIVLRGGTLLAVVAITAGFVLGLVGAVPAPGSQPVLDLIQHAGPDAITAAGLLGLTLLPLGVLGVAAFSFGTSGERRYLISSLVTLALLVGSLFVAALLAGAG
jgi:hypothetical protein